jgi:hypothetical protein
MLWENMKPSVRISGLRSLSFKQSRSLFVGHVSRYLDSFGPHVRSFSLFWLSLKLAVVIPITSLSMREDHALQDLTITPTQRFTDQHTYTVSGVYISPLRAQQHSLQKYKHITESQYPKFTTATTTTILQSYNRKRSKLQESSSHNND